MAQSVFAHVIVGNNDAYTVADWQSDISLAASKGIDAFVLNIATPLSGTAGSQSAFAFEAAKNLGASFKLFFSFDYEGGEGPWSTNDILTLLRQYGHDGSYFQYEGRPFVSTFEGPGNSDVSQWAEIRRALPGGIYFVPDWSSQGPGFEMPLYDGAFSWNMWPDGPQNMTTDPDIGWLDSLKKGGKSYMMGVSPWFYTNLPAYNKAWVWRGDSLWYDRWQQVLEIQPEFVQIVTWNDFGESHYIGPIRKPCIPSAPGADARSYVEGYPHEGWLETLRYQIAAYKHAANPTKYPAPKVGAGEDKIAYWYRTAPASTGPSAVTGNACSSEINVNGYQECHPVEAVLDDKIFAIALLSGPGSVSISVGEHPAQKFDGLEAGINFVSRPFGGQTGVVTVSSSTGASGKGVEIGSKSGGKVGNLNAWVGCAGACSGGSRHDVKSKNHLERHRHGSRRHLG
ncbi:Glucan endo-1,3-alpha-glucosidase agn1 [Vermiconidia calcicola]|uniref:Glucan endo-1,3-alpha-glucosidase agn1 n=1 Tax=Vermiconidia calcicola TaxID=1690605 RepID=A0ACC3NVN1_9PEZI|nr:Glucan endo-1,3-alpha-glucosidase agn1 [Vermiconidia calcicola]